MTGKTASLYPYPAVQYIPLLFENVAKGTWNAPPGWDRPSLLVARNDADWRESLRRNQGLLLPPLTLGSGEILLLGLRLHLLDLKYRGNFVTILADQTPREFHLIRFNQKLFYKDRIIFEVYAQDGTRLCWEPWDRELTPRPSLNAERGANSREG